MEEAIQASKVHLLSADHEDGGEHMWPVPFDPSLKEVTVSLSGPAPQIEVRDPAGGCPGERQAEGRCFGGSICGGSPWSLFSSSSERCVMEGSWLAAGAGEAPGCPSQSFASPCREGAGEGP